METWQRDISTSAHQLRTHEKSLEYWKTVLGVNLAKSASDEVAQKHISLANHRIQQEEASIKFWNERIRNAQAKICAA